MGRPRELSSAEREELLRQGFIPVEMWVPDWSNPDFLARMQDEARRIAEADRRERMDDVLDDFVRDLLDDPPR